MGKGGSPVIETPGEHACRPLEVGGHFRGSSKSGRRSLRQTDDLRRVIRRKNLYVGGKGLPTRNEQGGRINTFTEGRFRTLNRTPQRKTWGEAEDSKKGGGLNWNFFGLPPSPSVDQTSRGVPDESCPRYTGQL